jgi:hypothetical protein
VSGAAFGMLRPSGADDANTLDAMTLAVGANAGDWAPSAPSSNTRTVSDARGMPFRWLEHDPRKNMLRFGTSRIAVLIYGQKTATGATGMTRPWLFF